MSQAAKRSGSASALLAIIIAVAIVGGLAYYNLSRGAALSATSTVGPTGNGFTAYCAGLSVPGSVAAGVYPAGPGTNPPNGCRSAATTPSIFISDTYNVAKNLGSSYSCVFYYNAGPSPATFSILATGGVGVTGGVWVAGPGVQATSSGICQPTSWAAYPGTQIVVKVCIDGSATCVPADYSSQKTDVYCPLPSPAQTIPPSQNFPVTPCDPGGLAWGSMPYSASSAVNPVYTATIHIVMIAGQIPSGSNSGYNAVNPVLLDERYQNGTDYTSANTCQLSSTNTCDKPAATSLGKFAMSWGLTTGACSSCTAPANPAGSGYLSSTEVDFLSGPAARGPLQLVFSVEIKATTNLDICTITSPTLFGVTPLIISRSAADVFYLYVVNESSLTKITDVNGNTLNAGVIQAGVQIDCSAVYNGSGDVVTITPILYAYYSLQFFQHYNEQQINPEASALSQSAVITIKT
jgi:hypothetical protein